MKIFSRSLSEYYNTVKAGILLLATMAVIRFLMLPVFNIPYEQGTTYTSTFILLLVIGVFFTYRASQSPDTTYRDLLGIAFVLAISTQIITVIAIAIDDFGGIDTYFTDPNHSVANTYLHIIGHLLVPTTVSTLLIWGAGSLIKRVMGKSSQQAVA